MNGRRAFFSKFTFPELLAGGAGFFCAALGGMALLRLDIVSMPYLSGICLFLSGTGLTALALRLFRILPVICGALVWGIGATLFTGYAFGWRTGLDTLLLQSPAITAHIHERLSVSAGAGFALCGAGLLFLCLPVSAALKGLATWILSSFSLTLCLMALAGEALGFRDIFVSGTFIGMSPPTAVGLSVLSIGLLVTQSKGHFRLGEARWLPIPVAFGIAAASLVLWQGLAGEQAFSVRRQAETVARNVAADAFNRIRFSLRALELMKLRWEEKGGVPRQEWQADARATIHEEAIFAAIGRTDPDWRVERLEPADSDCIPSSLDPRHETRWDGAAALESSIQNRKMAVSPSINVNPATRGFIAYFPLFPDGKFDGFLFGVFRLRHLTESYADEGALANCRVSVFEGNELILGRPPLDPQGRDTTGESKIDFEGHEWRVVVEPGKTAVTGGKLPLVILCLGLFLGIALAAALWSWQQTLEKNRTVRAANDKLGAEIAERKKVEQAMGETQKLLEAAGRIARLGHWELPLDGGNLRWSRIMYDIHELAEDTSITPTNGLKFYHPEDRRAVSEHFQKSLESGEAFELEARLITAKARQIWVHLRGEPVRNGSGEIIAFHGTLQDVEDRHKAADLLKQRNLALEAATARAEAHARAKTEFLANMSHEIRTPLNAVIGMSELLMDGQLAPREREFVETIHSSGDVLLSLISDILDFSKIESGHLELERIPVDIRECAESVTDLLAGQAAVKKIDLMQWVDPAVPEAVLGDPTRLRQVLMNLVGNAIKFTGAGEVFLKVSVTHHDGVSFLFTAVSDTGIGIPEGQTERLFSAFTQVDASTTRRFGGTGLGLAISQRLIQNMGGRIWVDSQEGKGSVFQFEIQLLPAELSSAVSWEPSGIPSLEGLRILIVDDNATNRWILKMRTESWAMKPSFAEGSFQALELIDTGGKFDLAIIDVMMPDIDGYELVSRIRKRHSMRELPILMLTSMGETNADLGS